VGYGGDEVEVPGEDDVEAVGEKEGDCEVEEDGYEEDAAFEGGGVCVGVEDVDCGWI